MSDTFDHEAEAEAQRESLYFEGLGEGFSKGYYEENLLKTRRILKCRRCGDKDVEWARFSNGWNLVDIRNGAKHVCKDKTKEHESMPRPASSIVGSSFSPHATDIVDASRSEKARWRFIHGPKRKGLRRHCSTVLRSPF